MAFFHFGRVRVHTLLRCLASHFPKINAHLSEIHSGVLSVKLTNNRQDKSDAINIPPVELLIASDTADMLFSAFELRAETIDL